MSPVVDAFWRAAAYCVHPRVIVWSVLPLAASALVVLGLGWLYWEPGIDALRNVLDGWEGVRVAKQWLRDVGGGGLVRVLEPLILVALAVPVVVVLSLFWVAVLMTPALSRLVVKRRFAGMSVAPQNRWLATLAWSLGHTVVALLLLVASLPLWLIPPLFLVLPPLIWGWLTYRVMLFDVLADHATVAERKQILREHRWPLFGMGVVSGYLGAAPSFIWAAGALALVFAPLLILVSVWLYTLVFAFSALWFAHYALAALQAQRNAAASAEPPPPPTPPTPAPLAPASPLGLAPPP